MDSTLDTHTNSKGLDMTVSAERIEELTCFTDGALAAMVGGDGYYSEFSDTYLHATLEEVEAVFAYRAERDAKWEAEEAKKLTLAKTPVNPAPARPVLVARDDQGNVVNVGDKVVSFRGEPATLVSLDRAAEPGRSGKVTVRWDGFFDGSKHEHGFEGSYYDGVFNLTVSEA